MRTRKKRYGYVGISVKSEVRERLREQSRKTGLNLSTVLDYLSKISLTSEIKLNEEKSQN